MLYQCIKARFESAVVPGEMMAHAGQSSRVGNFPDSAWAFLIPRLLPLQHTGVWLNVTEHPGARYAFNFSYKAMLCGIVEAKFPCSKVQYTTGHFVCARATVAVCSLFRDLMLVCIGISLLTRARASTCVERQLPLVLKSLVQVQGKRDHYNMELRYREADPLNWNSH